MSAILVHELSKKYYIGETVSFQRMLKSAKHNLTRASYALIGRGPEAPHFEHEHIWALKDVSFEVKPGEILGIIGHNGSGKSTTLKILSRITLPTSGYAEMRGQVASLLEVGTGFNAELTGRTNVYLNGAILGMSKKDIRSRFNEIVEFSGIGNFIDTPIKRYSSGMTVRLAFAVASYLDSEILIIDEVLGVGDIAFQKKCLERVAALKRSGRTILFVSHSTGSVADLCGRALWLEKGRVRGEGGTDKIIQDYMKSMGVT